MLNVAFALTILLYAAFTIMLGGTPISLGSFTCLFLVTYFLLRFSPARYYLLPNPVIHVIFVSSYLIIGVGIGLMINIPPNMGLAVVYPVAVFGGIIILGLFLLTIGMLTLFIRAITIRSEYQNRINSK